MKELHEMKEVLMDQVKKISMKGDAISPQELDNAYKAVDIIKDITTIEAMKKAEEREMDEGRSYDYSYGNSMRPYFHMYPRGSYEGSYENSYGYDSSRDYSGARRGRDGDGDGRYSEDYSGRRGRDPQTGRYVSRDGSYEYSGHKEMTKEQMQRQIQEMQKKLNEM